MGGEGGEGGGGIRKKSDRKVYGKPEKRGGEKQETEIGEIYATLPKILKSKKCKEAGTNKKGRKSPGIKTYGKQEVLPPLFFPPDYS